MASDTYTQWFLKQLATEIGAGRIALDTLTPERFWYLYALWQFPTLVVTRSES